MKQLLAILFVAAFASISCAQETATMETQATPVQVERTKKTLKSVTLTAEQQAAFDAAAAKLTTEVAKGEANGLTKEKLMAMDAKRKEGRESGLKGKKLQNFMVEDLSEDELAAMMAYKKSVNEFDRTVAKMLTEEQLAGLPGKVKKRMTMLKNGKQGKAGKGKKKKKKNADEMEEADAEE